MGVLLLENSSILFNSARNRVSRDEIAFLISHVLARVFYDTGEVTPIIQNASVDEREEFHNLLRDSQSRLSFFCLN